MDVTFTNVLEGARQYFQGLPAATGSSASPAYPIGDQSHNTIQTANNNSGSNNRTPYWPPHQESPHHIRTTATIIREKQGSTPVDVNQLPSHHQNPPPPSPHHHYHVVEPLHRTDQQHTDNSCYSSAQNNNGDAVVQRVPPYHAESNHRSNSQQQQQQHGDIHRGSPFNGDSTRPTTESASSSSSQHHHFEMHRQQQQNNERNAEMQRSYHELQVPTTSHGDIQRPPSSLHGETQRPPSHHAEMQRPPSHHGELQRPPSHHQGEVQRPASHHGEMQRPPSSHHGEMQRPPSHHGEMQRPPSHHGELQRPPSHHQGEAQRPPSHHGEIQRPPSHHGDTQRYPSHHYVDVQQRPSSVHGNEIQRSPAHHHHQQQHGDNTLRPLSYHSEGTQRSQQQHEQEDDGVQRLVAQNHYPEQSRTANYSYAEPSSNVQFQFTRPRSSHEATSHVQQQYSTHILPNPTYHPQQQQQQGRKEPQLTNNSGQPYHQLQSSLSNNTNNGTSQSVASNNNHSPSRTYYQMTAAKPQNSPGGYGKLTPSSSHTYTHLNENSNAYSNVNSNMYTNSNNTNTQTSTVGNYPNQKGGKTIGSAVPESGKSHETTVVAYSQPSHRTTHNLPPIASLSSVNYHSNRNTRGIASGGQRGRSVVTARANNNSSNSTGTQQQYVTQQPQRNHNSVQQEHRNEVQQLHSIKSNYYHHNQQSSGTITTTTTTYTRPSSSSSSCASAIPQTTTATAYHHTVQKTTSQHLYHHHHQQQQQQQQQPPIQSNNNAVPVKLKRESPLDLSVKTIRTSADSTLDDAEEAQNINYTSSSRLMMVSTQQQSTSSSRSISYPTYEMSASTIQRNLTASRPPHHHHHPSSVAAPRVDFNPNFNAPSLKQTPQQQQAKYYNNNNNNNARRNQAHFNYNKNYATAMPYANNHQTNVNNNLQQRYANHNSAAVQNNASYMPKRSMEGLPRIDFPPPPEHGHKSPAMFPVNPNEIGKKRPAIIDSGPSMVPTKVPKIDNWEKTIDQQIEQKLSSYVKSKIQQQQQNEQKVTTTDNNGNKQTLVNGNYQQEKTITTYHRQYQSYPATNNQYATNHHHHHLQTNHNQTYVPSAVPHQYPDYNNAYNNQQMFNNNNSNHPHHHHQQSQWNNSQHQQIVSTQSPNKQSVGGGADKRVLSLLRNSLEIKGAKEAQRKLEQKEQQQQQLLQNVRADVQQPSTDVTAPLQPKTSSVGRHNVSPFTAASLLERTSNTPPSTYKFHFPKAMDSVKIDSEIHGTKNGNGIAHNEKAMVQTYNNAAIGGNNNNNTGSGDLDGLAAFLAARIRTKAELKQVTSSQNIGSALNNPIDDYQQSAQMPNGPMKPKDRCSSMYSPRKKLFCRIEEEAAVTATPVIKTASLPPREKSGMRSSSETSVFDFPDSDSELEMPVLERQSLEEMRRDRKSSRPSASANENETVKYVEQPSLITSSSRPLSSPIDDIFNSACDNFMEQLKKGIGKKRGRRKKDADGEEIKTESDSRNDDNAEDGSSVHDEKMDDIKMEADDSDSDVPLSECKKGNEPEHEPENVNVADEVKKEEAEEERAKDAAEEVCDKSKEPETAKEPETKEIADRSMPPTLTLPINVWPKPAKKPTFGDGSDFCPGWEEALYRYKKSLRMPVTLIHVTRPPNCQRLSSSLPDLDPCPISPAPSSIPDNLTEYNYNKSKTKTNRTHENVDSDAESNCSFNFNFTKTNYDSEGSSSAKSLQVAAQIKPKEHSILDKLLERYGPKKRKKFNRKKDDAPKIIPKADNEVELLPTPSLEVKSESKQIIRGDSVLLGFRKKTVENFKDAFIKNTNSVVGVTDKFATVVLNSRTRKQTRVLKQKATIREVFGEDRPASAPPVTCIDDLKQRDAEESNVQQQMEVKMEEDVRTNRKGNVILNPKEMLKSKLMNKGKKQTEAIIEQTDKVIKTETPDENSKDFVDNKSETASLIDGDDAVLHINIKKKAKLRNIRRKFSSGFDYIRKKKKQIKKETVESESATVKQKKRAITSKAMPESVQDIQKEIKTWVLNKGIGETHLHRAARLGYTDVTAYCLEKMNCPPSPKDNAGYTPLHEACSRGHLSIAKLLLIYGANVSESAQGGIRPLHEAAENGYVEIVRLLLSFGADPALATYSGLTPLSLAVDDTTITLLQNHLADVQGQPTAPWHFPGPATCFDLEETGYNPLEDVPEADKAIENEDLDFEVSDVLLPNLYTLSGENPSDRWVLLQDLSNVLKIKSRDTLLKQLGPPAATSSSSSLSNNNANNNKNIIKEMKMNDFLEQAQCCQFLNAGEKINIRASKIALVKYTDKVRQLLNVEKVVITSR